MFPYPLLQTLPSFPTPDIPMMFDPISWQMIFMALAASASIAALAYMAGELFSMPALKGFSKLELSELGVSAAIIILVALLIMSGGPFDLVAQGFMHQTGTLQVCPEWANMSDYDPVTQTASKGNVAFGTADYFLGCRLAPGAMLTFLGNLAPIGTATASLGMYELNPGGGVMMPRILKGYADLTWNEVLLGAVSTFDFSLGIPAYRVLWITIGGIMPFTGLSLISEANIMVTDALMTVWSAFAAQKMLLSFIQASALVYFLPMGLLFRAFPFSRKTGSTIIALVFAAYFIYPTSILINEQIFYIIQNPSGAPNCKDAGEACSMGTDPPCCSGQCRFGNCTSTLTDFTEYESIFAVCDQNPLADPAGFTNGVHAQTGAEAAAMQQYIDAENAHAQQGNPVAPQKTEAQQQADALALEAQQGVSSSFASTAAMTMGSLDKVTPISFSYFQNSLLDVSKWIVVTMFFVVLEIVITMTLLKDFSVLIGGEPRILGLGKLV